MWFWKRRNSIRKINKSSIGIVLCIHISDNSNWHIVQEDFVKPLANEIKGQDKDKLFDILILPPHITSRYTSMEEADPLLTKTGARALIFGFVRKREKRFIIDLTCSVRHKLLQEEAKTRFQNDISAAWVRRFNLDNQEHRIEPFEISSAITSICAKYVLALSLYASQDFVNSEIIFSSLRAQLKATSGEELPPIRTIRLGTSKNLNFICLLQAQHYLRLWHQTGELTNIEIMERILAKTFGAFKRNGHYLTLVSIANILLKSDFRSAKSNLQKIKKNNRNTVWHLNIAFINACEGNENGVIDNYEIAKNRFHTEDNETTFELISELEEFIERYRVTAEDNPLFYFMLAYLNSYFKGDKVKASADSSAFIQHRKSTLYPKAKNLLYSLPDIKEQST